MGRRTLPKLDTALDLSRHYCELTPLAAGATSLDLHALFDRTAPLELEIGSGKGLFISAAASQTPDHDFMGVELAVKYARHAAARLAKRQLPNARLIQGDACRLVRELIPSQSLTAVHVYFPDPWWKARHKKRRVMNEHTVQSIERVLNSGGKLHFWTDVHEYFETTLELLANHTQLAGPFEVVEQPAEHDLDYRTHFERRMRKHGLPVYRAEFRKEPADTGR